MKPLKRLSLILLLFFFQSLYFSQSVKNFHIPDSLKNKNFEQLKKSYDKVFKIDNKKAELYANTILYKGKKEKSNDFIYDGYYKLAYAKGLNSENGHPFADSLLKITQYVNTKEYPAKAHIVKGILLNNEFKYKEALDHYILAQNLSKNKNPDQFFYLKKLMGILKTATDENKEALSLFLEYYQYEKKKMETDNKDVKSYIGSIFSLSNSYSKNKQYQQSKLYNKIGLTECKKYNDYTHHAYFIMSEGIAEYYLKNYPAAILNLKSIEKNLLENKNYANLSILYYYLGKINYETKKENNAVYYFIKSDSLSFASNDFIPITRDGYEILIDYYKKKGDNENQLKFIDKLFYADSIINNSKQYLSKEIYKKYDTPILLEKKEEVIHNLNTRNILLYWFLCIGFLVILLLIYMYRRRIKQYQQQADLLLEKSKVLIIPPTPENVVKEQNISLEEKAKNILPDSKLQDLKIKLEQFENNKEFLRKNITSDSLAKDLGTNRDYLSKSVNELKGKNFSQYLNELRINYIIEELKYNEKLRKYTISSIANDIGYNSSESFANAFKKITGTLPSYYIKSLQESAKKHNIDNQQTTI
ncbi:AraC family transcriptional regulator [Chryseobacterium sp. PS-8]|uniref:AraC family transcriptional regulator n=1 Tax=Chryseobacterium indicum TaxID=2766954 RepID=A0ABS9CCE8_9FLAO|nr:AraC family transcriptional regulator [Chryseobacterium sp. PS-8]MCF2221041.1 AraC family transcriptional regulator [Chryseobacterium sp. PS-8]